MGPLKASIYAVQRFRESMYTERGKPRQGKKKRINHVILPQVRI